MNPLNILVVDDKRVIGDLFRVTLGHQGHLITVINDPTEVVDVLKNFAFDIAFFDIVMPEIDGVQLLQEAKRISPNLPIVMMSGFSVTDKRLQALSYGAAACLTKPFNIEDIEALIRDTVSV